MGTEEEENNELRSLNVEATDISENERLLLRGDAVGDTAYSAKWILKTLISLSKLPEDVEWSSELETDLCLLWDMAAEKDVILFLVENQFLSIAEYVLSVSKHERLTEIIVGLIGNLCSQPSVIPQIAERGELTESLLNLLVSNDTETLVQLMRVLQAAAWNLQRQNYSEKWLEHWTQCKFMGHTLIFILKSSTNENLLIATLKLIQAITTIEAGDGILFAHIFDMKELLLALLESFAQLIPSESNDDIHTSTETKVIESWLEILSKILELSAGNIHEIVDNHKPVIDALARILEPYKVPENLKMSALEEHTIIGYIYQTVELINWFQKSRFNIDAGTISIILEIMFQLQTLTNVNSDDSEEAYRITGLKKSTAKYWKNLLAHANPENLNDILNSCSEETTNYLKNLIASRHTENSLLL